MVSLVQEATRASKANVSVLRDRGFRMLPMSDEESSVQHFWWDQPAIESNLFLYHCGKWSKERKGEHPFAFLRDPTVAAEFATKYFTGFKYHDPKAEGAFLLFERWAAAMAAKKKNAPTENDFRAVAAVVHGRLWVEKVQRTTAAALINAIEEDIIEFCPELVGSSAQLQELMRRRGRCSR